MFEFETLTRYVNIIRPWPWRTFAIVTIISFLLASAVSSLLGWILMPMTKVPSVTILSEEGQAEFNIAHGLAAMAVEKILERNLFNSEGIMGEMTNTDSDKMAKTMLPIKVLGIIYGGSPHNGIAMIENNEGKSVNSFLVGDLITTDAKVLEILRDMVIIENMGRKEFAPLEEIELRRTSRKGGVKKPNTPATLGGSGYATDAPPETFKEDGFERKGGNIELTSEYKNRLLTTDFASVLQDAKASPNLVSGVIKGWRMDRIRKNSFWEKSGIQNGDVIEEINGVILSGASQAVSTLKSLRNESEVEIKLNRNGQNLILNLKVR